MALELRDLRKRYGALDVLQPLSLAIADGEFLTLLGPSGSGKTTVLRLIGGFLEPSSGKIIFDGSDITTLPPNRRPFNTVFQDYALFPHMTVAQNIGYGPLVQKRDAAKLIAETIDIVGLGDFRERYPSQLSGGQKQRVALARAIVCEPKVILLDEPLAALDANLRRQMQVFLKQIQRRIKTTFVFVTHDQDEAIAMSDRIVVMNLGRIEQVGTPEDIYFRPRTRFVAGFFGDNNIIEATLAAPHVADTPLGRLPVGDANGAAPGQKVLIAIRPESLRFGDGIATEVEDVNFGGALNKLVLRPLAANDMRLDMRLPGDGRAAMPKIGDRLSVTYEPAGAVVIADA
jgi:ABC-type Fe3+/spermidine/putrescine transport system ATPase subunit